AATMKHHLIFEENFNEKSVAGFIKNYVETIEFAGLNTTPDGNSPVAEGDEPDQMEEDGNEGASVQPAPADNSQQKARSAIKLIDGDVEIGKFPVSKNCTIRLISNGEVGKKAIQALVAQLQLNLELGVFDDEVGS